MNAIVFNTLCGVKRAAVIFDDQVYRFMVFEDKEGRTGDIYMARVVKVLDSIQAAFVDLGMERNGYLQKEDMKGGFGAERISDLIKPGDEIAVQIKKEAVGDKGPKVTTKLSIQGSGIVFYDDDRNRLAVSKKIKDPEAVVRLKNLAHRLHHKTFGMIFRTHAENLAEEALEKEYESLLRKWEDLAGRILYSKAPQSLCKEKSFAAESVVNNVYRGLDQIVFDCREDLEDVRTACPGMQENLFQYMDPSEGLDTFSLHGIEKAMDGALKKKIWLKSGGNLIIEETEALTAIDVNLAKSSHDRGNKDVAGITNEEAAFEAGRQIILRNLSGIILIDFIDSDQTAQERLCGILSKILSEYDNRRFDVYGFTKAGLLEMAREKKGMSLRGRYFHEASIPEPIHTQGRVEKAMSRIKLETVMQNILLKTDLQTGEWLEGHSFEAGMKRRYGLSVALEKDRTFEAGKFEISYL